jgi:hypothetical protein
LRVFVLRASGNTLSALGQDVTKLKVEHDVALVEMEEIAASKRCVSSAWAAQTVS